MVKADVMIIGAGPAGMTAAYAAASAGRRVLLLEKNEKTGKKLYISGKGRCNVTNDCAYDEFFENVIGNPKFLYGALRGFGPADTARFLNAHGLELKTERGGRVFPASDKSSDVLRTFGRALREAGAEIALNSEITSITRAEDGLFTARTRDGREFCARGVIIASGGASYPATGSTGDGYRFASAFGHSVAPPRPSLVRLICRERFIKDLEGLTLKNVNFRVEDGSGREVYSDFGEILFTADGVSGPLALSASAKITRIATGDLRGSIDLKPALSREKLDARVLRDFSAASNKMFKNALDDLLPRSLIPVAVSSSGIPPEKAVNAVTREERAAFVSLLKDFRLTIGGTGSLAEAIVTAGGVDVGEVDPKTMGSKLVGGLYFAGEVLDVDALTGGFNIQIAMSTGYAAGRAAAGRSRE